MKAINTNTNRILSTIGLLVLAVSIGYGQGFLAESAVKLFTYNKPKVEVHPTEIILAGYAEKEEISNFKHFLKYIFTSDVDYVFVKKQMNEVVATKTIIVPAVNVSYEAGLESEAWMETPLSNNLENGLDVEGWMTQPISSHIEKKMETEEWMTIPLSESLEDNLVAEYWMTQSFSQSLENELETEKWMTEPFADLTEDELSVEVWMTQSLSR